MTKNTEIAHLIVEGMTASAEEAFLKWMIKRAPVKPMETDKESFLGGAEEWWLAKLRSGDILPGRGWINVLPIQTLTDNYIAELKRHDITMRGNSTAMGRFLKAVCYKLSTSSKVGREGNCPEGKVGKRIRHYLFPRLDLCREMFEAVYGKQDWVDSEESVDDAQKGDSQYPDGD